MKVVNKINITPINITTEAKHEVKSETKAKIIVFKATSHFGWLQLWH